MKCKSAWMRRPQHSGSHKQRSKDLSERLRMEDTKLQRKQQNLKEAQSLRDRWHGEHSVI